MKEVPRIQPAQWTDAKPGDVAAEHVDKWFADFFHGPHHVRNIGDVHAYLVNAVVELKRRLRDNV